MPAWKPGVASNDMNPPPVRQISSTSPYAIVPSDSADLKAVPFGIYVGTGGDVRLKGVEKDAEIVTYKNLPDASYIAVRAARVYATGTTATNMIAEA